MVKQKNKLNVKLPKFIFLLTLSISIGSVIFGFINDMIGETCMGIMGASISCIDRIILFPFATLLLPLLMLSGAWWLVSNMSRDVRIDSKKNGKSKN